MDMAGFAIHINLFIQMSHVKLGYQPGKHTRSKQGFMESDLFKSIGTSREELECKGVPNEVNIVYMCCA